MYLYSFDRFFGFDKVCILAENASRKKVKAWDLLIFGNQYFLVLGENISFSEQYQHLTTTQAELVYKGFLSLPTLKLFHWMVEHHYTTYKSVVKLFVARDIQKLLEREGKLKNWKIEKLKYEKEGQTLIVFPDLRTMTNSVGTMEQLNDGTMEKWDSWNVVTLLSGDTEKQKDVHRWEIKKWMKSVIICTYAEIFQDFNNLKKIIFVDPHKRYYAAQQDPRYKVGEVLAKMGELHGAEVKIVGV